MADDSRREFLFTRLGKSFLFFLAVCTLPSIIFGEWGLLTVRFFNDENINVPGEYWFMFKASVTGGAELAVGSYFAYLLCFACRGGYGLIRASAEQDFSPEGDQDPEGGQDKVFTDTVNDLLPLPRFPCIEALSNPVDNFACSVCIYLASFLPIVSLGTYLGALSLHDDSRLYQKEASYLGIGVAGEFSLYITITLLASFCGIVQACGETFRSMFRSCKEANDQSYQRLISNNAHQSTDGDPVAGSEGYNTLNT